MRIEQVREANSPEEMRAEISRLRREGVLVRSVMDMADYRGLSAEDRFTVLAYYALKDLAVAQKTILEHVLITPNPFFTAAQSTTTVGREG